MAVKYKYGLNEAGKVVSIYDLTEADRGKTFRCIGCGCELTLVLKEGKRERHFRHKSSETACVSFESYLHNLGKKVLKARFEDKERPFVIYIERKNCCTHKAECKFASMFCGSEYFLDEINLNEWFDTCETEKGIDGFIGDVRLTSTKHPNRKMFFEIFYTHEVSQRKRESGIKMIEFKVNSEDDVYALWNCKIVYYREKKHGITFHNFKRDGQENQQPHKPLKRYSYIDEDHKITVSDITCDQWFEHKEESTLEVATLPDERRGDVVMMVEANIRKLGLKHCGLCSKLGYSCNGWGRNREDGTLIDDQMFLPKICGKYSFYEYGARQRIKDLVYSCWENGL